MIYAVSAIFNDTITDERADEAFENAQNSGFDIFMVSHGDIAKGVLFIDDTYSFVGMLGIFQQIYCMPFRSFSIMPEQDYMDEINPNPSKLLNIF